MAADTPPGTDRAPAGPPGSGSQSGAFRQTIGRFVVTGELGRGGYGVVYRALDPTLGRPIAVKLLRDDSTEGAARERLLREARAVARLGKHPNIVQVHDAGATPEGHAYIAMELVDGESLERIAARRRFVWDEAGEIARKVALGLEHAHRHGLIHRDVKPSNVILDGRGEPQITDFGIAKDLESGSASITKTGSAIGTPAFMSPEQAQGLPVDARTDVYGVGALLHALIRGRAPFVAPHVAMVLAQVIDRAPPRMRSRKNKCPRDLETVVLKAMEKDPAARYASAEELAGDLGRVLAGEPCAARRPGLVEQAVRHFRRRPRNLVILLGVAAAAYVTYRYREEKVAYEQVAKQERRLEGEEVVRQRLAGVQTVVNFADRLKICDDAIRDFPLSWQPYHERGLVDREIALASIGTDEEKVLLHFRAAEADFTRAIELNPKAVDPYFFRGIVRNEALDDHEGGDRDLDQVLALQGFGVLVDVAKVARAGANATDEDLERLDAAIKKMPHLGILLETRGAARLLRGQHQRALEDLDASLKVAPLCGRAHAYRAMALAALGRKDEALQAAERAVGLAPSGPYGYEARSIVRMGAGDAQGALDDITKALSVMPRDDPSRAQDEELMRKIQERLRREDGS
jgi:tetratricopeptide (TPR) repeat protein